MSNLTEARFKLQIMDAMRSLISDGRITEAEMPELASLPYPKNQEELSGFILPLFLHGIAKAMPGCPARENDDTISIRLDGEQYRKAKEVRQIMERSAVRQYISEKDRSVYRAIDGRMSDRISRLANLVREGDRDFYHIRKETILRQHEFHNHYSQLIRQGREDAEIAGVYDRVMALVSQRQEEKRAEFLAIRQRMNTQYVEHAKKVIEVPFELIQRLGAEGKALVEQLTAKGLHAFYRKPSLLELASSEISVDVFSGIDEADDSWYMAPVTTEILASDDTRLYHGQGTITAYDPESEYSLNGQLPFEVQHCIRTAASLDTFMAALPEEMRNAIATTEALSTELLGRDSHDIKKEDLEKLPAEAAPVLPPVEEAKVDELTASIQAQLQGTAPQPAPRKKGVRKAKPVEVPKPKTLDEIIAEQLASAGHPAVEVPAPQPEPEVTLPPEPAPVEPDDYEDREEEEEESHGLTISDVHHPSHGNNPIFYQMVDDPTGSGQLVQYIAFRGVDARFFMEFNEASIYSGKAIGNYAIPPFEQRFTALSDMPDGTAIRHEEFNGLLF